MGIPNREEIALKDRWDLTPLYISAEDWERELKALDSEIEGFRRFRGRLGESAHSLCDAVVEYLNLDRKLERVYSYAQLLSDTDLGDTALQACKERALAVAVKLSAATSFFRPELLGLPSEQIQALVGAPELADYRRMLDEIVRYKPHTLSDETEEVLALGEEVHHSFSRVFSQLNNADFDFGSITVDGEERPLSHGTFVLFLKHRNREIRKNAFDRYYSVFNSHRYTIAANFAASVKKDVFLARARKYPSALEASLFHDNVSPTVYESLLSAVNRNLEQLHNYYRYRAEVLQLPKLAVYDSYVPLVPEVETKIPYEEGVELILEALQPLGAPYLEVLKKGLVGERWVDRYENRGKRSGAYSGGCYDSPPYILLNYKETDLNSLFTIAHEAGHSMHSYLSRNAQRYQDYQYTIFVAEVASTFNEQLLAAHLKKVYKDNRRMVAYLLNQEIEDIRATLYRQTMFAEFETIVHQFAEEGQPLTVDVMRSVYRGLLEKYFGADIELPPAADLECLRIPHFYNAFYVYKYATGISAAAALADQVLSGDSLACERYLDFLKAGRTKFPLELLQDAGVDLTNDAIVSSALEKFKRLVDELKESMK